MDTIIKPLSDAELAEVKRLYEAATPGEWRMFYGGEPLLIGSSGELVADMEYPRDAEAVTALHNAFPGILARLEELQAYRDAEVARRAKADCYDRICEHLGVESNVLGAIAARDAQQRRDGAAAENDYWAEEHEGLLGGHVSAAHVVRAFNLREGGE